MSNLSSLLKYTGKQNDAVTNSEDTTSTKSSGLASLLKYTGNGSDSSSSSASENASASSGLSSLLKYTGNNASTEETGVSTATTTNTDTDSETQNNGGVLGGIGYTLEKVGLGALSSVEGIWDYVAGGLAKLFGQDDWAEQQFANDWVDYNHADNWYNPSSFWQTAGDVGGGIGTSLVNIAAVTGASILSGGTLTPLAAGVVSGLTAGLGAAGNATKEAYQTTGELGGKEFAYGAISGATEAGVESLSSALGAGTGAVVKRLSTSLGKDVTKTVARESIGKAMLKGFAGEAFEEGLQAILEPWYKRMTYDETAENATLQEVAYSALVGGLSGAIMSGGDVSIRSAGNLIKGNKIVNENKANGVIELAENISEYENANKTEDESFQAVQSALNELKTSLEKTNGEIKTAKQKMLVGYLQNANTAAVFSPMVSQSAQNIVANAEVLTEKYKGYDVTDSNGNKIEITAEQIRSGLENGWESALKTNDVLRTLAVNDVTGKLIMNNQSFVEATLSGQALSSQVDLNRFIETATDAELDEVGSALGIENWQALTNDELRNRIIVYAQNGGLETQKNISAIKKQAQSISAENVKDKVPYTVPSGLADGITRYSSDGMNIAIIKDGKSYRLYDYETGRLSKEMTRKELSNTLVNIRKERNALKEQAQAEIKQTQERAEKQARFAKETAEIDSLLRENVKEYSKLSAGNQSMIRSIIRQARANGISETDALSYARVSAHSGINIVFSKELNFVGTQNGTPVYADGFYDAKKNRIVVNPETKRTHEAVLIHELTHAIYTRSEFDTNGNRTNFEINVEEEVQNMSEEEKKRIQNKYKKVGKGGALEVSDEINAHYAEDILTNQNILERLTKEKPSLKQRILDFFSGAKNDYSKEDTKLSKSAERLYKNYKKMFDLFTEENAGKNQNIVDNSFSVKTKEEYLNQAENSENQEKRYALEPYSEKQIENWKNSKNIVIYESSQQLQEFISESIANNQYNKKMYFGKIGSELASKIENKVGLNLAGYNYSLQSNEVRKILNSHGDEITERNRGQRAVTEADFLEIPEILENANNIILSDKPYDEKPVIKFEKINGNEKTTVVAVVSDKHLDLRIQTEYINIKKDTLVTPSSEQALNHTPEAPRNTGVINDSISNSKENVNSKNENSSKRYALPDTDSNGNKLSSEQSEFFKNSKVVDENGKLKVVYHGSDAQFTEFLSEYISDWNAFGDGYYFTDSKERATAYAKKNLFETYLNIKNPLNSKNKTQLESVYKKLNLTREKVMNYAQKEGLDGSDLFLLNYYAGENDINISDAIKELGFDGIVSENFEDTEYVVFSSNQIKLTTNIAPSMSEDIRYALQEDSDLKDLVAVHNTTESKLLQSIELGGLAMPSVAIIKNDMGHEGFGEISLILNSQAIDPQSNYNNKVYSADAYSPRFPQTDYSLNGKELKKLAEKMDTSVAMLEANDFAEANSRDDIINNLKNNDDFIKHYVKEFNYQEKVIYKNPGYSQRIYLYEDTQEFLRKNYPFRQLVYNKNVQKQLENAVMEAKNKKTYAPMKNIVQDAYDKFLQHMEDARNDKYIYEILEEEYKTDKLIAQGKAEKIKDNYKTKQNTIEELKNDKHFNSYVEETVDKVLDKKYLRNNKNYYTDSGNPRSFNSLHEEYTAENAVKLMKEQGSVNGENGNFFGIGLGEIRAALSKIYNSISEMHQDESRLQKTETSTKLYEDCNNELYELAEKLSEKVRVNNFLERREIALNAIFDIISKTETPEQAKKIIKRDYTFEITNSEIAEIRSLAEKIAELPVKYFEAKPERVVDFNEIAEVVAPKGTNKKIIDFFEKQGTKIELYDGEEKTRQRIIKELPDNVRFALQDDTNFDDIDPLFDKYDTEAYEKDAKEKMKKLEEKEKNKLQNKERNAQNDVKITEIVDNNGKMIENTANIELSRGQTAKVVANNTRDKVYTKQEARTIIYEITNNDLEVEKNTVYKGMMKSKDIKTLEEALWIKLNTTDEGYRSNVALDTADYILNNAVFEDVYADNSRINDDLHTLDLLKKFFHNITLKDQNIRYDGSRIYDARTGKPKGNSWESEFPDVWNSVRAKWVAPKGVKGSDPSYVAEVINDALGKNFDTENDYNAMHQIVDLYNDTIDDYNKLTKQYVSEKIVGDKDSKRYQELRQKIARDVLNAYDEFGVKSKKANQTEKIMSKIKEWKNKVKDIQNELNQTKKSNRLENYITSTAKYLKDIGNGKAYVGSETLNSPELTAWLKEAGKLEYRNNLRKSGTREIVSQLGTFYNENNTLLYDSDERLNYIDKNVVDAIEFIKQNEKSDAELSYEELRAVDVILKGIKHLYQTFDQMILDGRKVTVTETATEAIRISKNAPRHTGKGFFNWVFKTGSKIVEPRTVIKALDGFNPHGINQKLYNDITNGETKANLTYMTLMSDFDEFFKTNKKYDKRLANERIDFMGNEITIGEAITLYELSKREQAKAGLYESGIAYFDEKGVKQTIKGFTETEIKNMAKQFTETDKKLIKITEKFFNEKASEIKRNADAEILGYTNALEEFYFPIKRDDSTIARNITDGSEIMSDFASVYAFSFNKDVREGAKNKLFVRNVYDIISRHAKQLSIYANLTIPLKNYAQVYAKNIGTKTDIVSLKDTLNTRVWDGTEDYLKKLFTDIQGSKRKNGILEKIRSAYAKYQLGANLKVIVSQVTSYPTAGIYLDGDVLAKGFVMKTNYEQMDKYSPYAAVRNYEKGIVRAESVSDKVSKVGDYLTKPIQWTDRLTIGRLWNACQLQVEKDYGYKVGTEENLKQAGILHEEVIRNTQPNYSNTERSELMRSDSDFWRSFTMFTSVPLKQLSRLADSVYTLKSLSRMIKEGNSDPEILSAYKAAKKQAGRTVASVVIANLMYSLVAQGFKWLYNNQDEDDDGNKVSFLKSLATDFSSTTIGMFPIIKDIYNYFANGYEFSNFAIDTLNTVAESTQELFTLATSAINGEVVDKTDIASTLRDSIYSIGLLTGIPVRNIQNTVVGLVKRFDEGTAYKYNTLFYNASYTSDIKKALEDGDYDLAETIMDLLLKEEKAGGLSKNATSVITKLYEQGYSVLPKSVSETITVGEETYTLSSKQYSKFKEVYSEASDVVEDVISSSGFEGLSESAQAKAIKQVYDAYYEKAKAEVLGIETDNKILALSKWFDVSEISIIFAGLNEISSETDSSGNTISGSKKKNIIAYLLKQNLSDGERLFLICYQGYTISDGDYKNMTQEKAKKVLLKWILGLKNTTASEKAELATICGFEVSGNKIKA